MLTGMGASFVIHQPGFSFHLAAYRGDAFLDVDRFKADMDDYLRGLTETPPVPGCDRVASWPPGRRAAGAAAADRHPLFRPARRLVPPDGARLRADVCLHLGQEAKEPVLF